ncbi:hypothetical protein AMC99_00615 [Altererythrobacter epoxidivorans]|uniref:Uncharacterized protein n=1 Tax=Altererythrobacter epoxidivorans TaxID=361183 RepID=A0A0M4MUD3_9SPHN|nr:hypothetical protein [Altererythrobacter epoxidivorans]ALE15925.1 hypothetical protein AMC99_00615 [Altererythrobacter epoxidivorans]
MKQNVIKALAAGALVMTAASPWQAVAQDEGGEALSQEEQVDNGLKNFGYIAGLSRGCVAESQQVAFERDVLDMHASISRLLGVDRAFLFSAAFGYGTSVAVETENCAEILRQYEKRSAKFRNAAQGG